MNIKRRKTRQVKIGRIRIGCGNPIAIQSMTKTRTADVVSTVKQAKQLEEAGADIIRLAVLDEQDARALRKIKQGVNAPLVADIHFNWKLALAAIDSGVDKIRLNPGNVYRKEEVREVVSAAKLARIPIRVGINSGSLRGRSMTRSAMDYVRLIESFGFYDIVVSLKASTILGTIEAYRKFSRMCDYPLHLGVTATGPADRGVIKSSVAIGSLLLDGIGDTIRVSLTDEPKEEVRSGRVILESLGLKKGGIEIISCPTCGRCEVNLRQMVRELENRLSVLRLTSAGAPLTVAMMGCMVNGPGEAREADAGIAFAKKEGLLFKSGKPVKKIALKDCVNVLTKEAAKICCGQKRS
ncbi:MAG: flavodoxin-dependent (E)-4-hydroxy-3-methylbut-2-enyl-diphosphate synthase [Candidatus Omnitrophica bacterium]|nr:flavodoxin-dependent (E)-4-hydroxy-3-methylbut-2-enyl-diphosphate synthase [Candidatus Omnitrophota bacterium]MDD5654430.1 flavodoxin-dependent (E)-4-hydroxy-3-methylbut-2-enyl-diphosphate synthase [Candidatus Omnitrophota bacterium]